MRLQLCSCTEAVSISFSVLFLSQFIPDTPGEGNDETQ